MAVGSSSDILAQRLEKSCGKSSTGIVLSQSLKCLLIGKASFSGKMKSFRHCSSSVTSLISPRSSAWYCKSSYFSIYYRTFSQATFFAILIMFFRFSRSAFSWSISSVELPTALVATGLVLGAQLFFRFWSFRSS